MLFYNDEKTKCDRPFLAKAIGDEIIKVLEVDINQLEVRKLEKIDLEFMAYNMDKASNYWNISNDIIPKRKRLEMSILSSLPSIFIDENQKKQIYLDKENDYSWTQKLRNIPSPQMNFID